MKLQKNYSINGIEYCLNNFCIEDNLIKFVELIESITRRKGYVEEDRNVRMESFY